MKKTRSSIVDKNNVIDRIYNKGPARYREQNFQE